MLVVVLCEVEGLDQKVCLGWGFLIGWYEVTRVSYKLVQRPRQLLRLVFCRGIVANCHLTK